MENKITLINKDFKEIEIFIEENNTNNYIGYYLKNGLVVDRWKITKEHYKIVLEIIKKLGFKESPKVEPNKKELASKIIDYANSHYLPNSQDYIILELASKIINRP